MPAEIGIPALIGTTVARLGLRHTKTLAIFSIAALFIAPLLGSMILMLEDAMQSFAWTLLFRHPQLWPALGLSFFTGICATVFSLILSLMIAAQYGARLRPNSLGAMLAVPHLAFAIGFGFLIMPSGFLARVIAIPLGWASPPHWITTHDPYGLALIFALVCKEAAFLLFVLISILSRADVAQSFVGQRQAAKALGHGEFSIWTRLFIPQLLPQLIWPLVIVFVYAASVVDMALVLGPTQPPTFATVIWTDVNASDPADNARGGAGAVFLSLALAALILLVVAVGKSFLPLFKSWATRGPSLFFFPRFATIKWPALNLLYAMIVLTLIMLSWTGLWAFPVLWPTHFSAKAWLNVVGHSGPLVNSLGLALATSFSALALLVLWLETVAEEFDRWLLILCVIALGLPALLIGIGQYRLFLRLGLTGEVFGLYLAHLMPVVAYMFIMLKGPYRAFDPRWRDVASGLMATARTFLFSVKWPMLKAPLLSALAVGFTVSIAQYVPAQLISAGRFSTLPMEAVTLSSGADRALTAAFALLLMVPPLIAFGLASWLGRPRWRLA